MDIVQDWKHTKEDFNAHIDKETMRSGDLRKINPEEMGGRVICRDTIYVRHGTNVDYKHDLNKLKNTCRIIMLILYRGRFIFLLVKTNPRQHRADLHVLPLP